MQSFKIIPILGLKNSVPQDDPSLFKIVDKWGKIAMTHDTDGINVTYTRERNAVSKAYGYQEWSNTANAQATRCMGLFELYDGTHRDHCFWDNGKFYVYDNSYDPADKTASGVTHANDDNDLYSIIQFGDYVIWADMAETTPYKWKNGDANATKLIQSGTEYKFRYLEEFQGRIIGAYSDQTNGDLEIRWTDRLPTWATLDFGASNQAYKPDTTDPITGIKKITQNACMLYGEESMARIEYYPSGDTPFVLRTTVFGHGPVNHHSIVAVGSEHYFFHKQYGFVRYQGETEYPYGGKPISEDIEDTISAIDTDYYTNIVGVFVPITREIVWTIPLSDIANPTHLLFYNVNTGQWRMEEKAMRYIDTWQLYPSYTWAQFVAELGGATADWTAASSDTWAKYTTQYQRLAYANTDGRLYIQTGDDYDGSAFEGYRVEPIFDFGERLRMDRVVEVWLEVTQQVDVDVNFYWRGGATVAEVIGKAWESIGSINCNNPAAAVLYMDKTDRLHQFKWGTDGAAEGYEADGLIFKYIEQGIY